MDSKARPFCLLGDTPWFLQKCRLEDAERRGFFVTAGYGHWKQADYVTAALADDGRAGVVYPPSAREFTVDLARFTRQPVNARWFDPTSGQSSPVAGAPFDNAGKRDLLPPVHNAAGESDFVLVLEAR